MTSATPTTLSVQRRLTDLHTYQLPRLRTCTGPIGLHGELSDELRLDLAVIRRSMEIAKEEVELIQGYEEREAGWRVYEVLEREYNRARAEYRSALLYSKKRISTTKNPLSGDKSASALDDRYELKTNSTNTAASTSTSISTTHPPRSTEFGVGEQDAVQTKTNEVTVALRRTLGTMQVELEKSVLSVQMLEDSTRTLRATSGLYDTYTSLLNTSSQLVKALERADWWDRCIIALAFLLFLLTVGWVIKRRVLDKVVGGVGWWVGGSARLVKLGLGFGGGGGKAKGKVVDKAAKAAVRAGAVKKIEEVGKIAKGKGKVLSSMAASVSTIATVAASALSSGSALVESSVSVVAEPTPTLAGSVVAPPPPSSVSAISPPDPSSGHDEL